MTDHMSLLRFVTDQRDKELSREIPSPTAIIACDVAIRKLNESGHCKTFAMLSQPTEMDNN